MILGGGVEKKLEHKFANNKEMREQKERNEKVFSLLIPPFPFICSYETFTLSFCAHEKLFLQELFFFDKSAYLDFPLNMK